MSDKQLNSVQSPIDAATLRKEAEEQAWSMEPTYLSTQTPEEIQQVIHELRVHQIELEMQNEELRSAEAQIDVERERYFDIYDQAPVGYCTLSEKGLILEGNLTAATLLGVNRSALVKQPFSRFILKEDLDIYYLYRKHLFDPGEPQGCELRLVKPDGTSLWAHLTATTAQAEDGAPICRLVIIDITRRRQDEEVLRRKDHDLRESQRIAHVGSWRLDVATNKVVWTEELYKMYGLDPSLPPPPYTEHMKLFTPESWERLSTALAHTRNTGIPYELELETVRKNGSNGWMWVRGEAEKDTEGRIISLWGAAQDITERKRTENELQASQEKLQNLIQNLHAGLVVHALDTSILFANAQASELLGLTNDQLMGKMAIDPVWCFIHEDGTPFQVEEYPVSQVFATQGPVQNMTIGIIRPSTSDCVWALVNAFPELDTHGCVSQAVITFIDITDRKQAQEALFAEGERLEFVIDGSRLGTWAWNVQTNETIFNEAWATMLGYTLEELTPTNFETWNALTHPEDSKKVESLLAHCLTGEKRDFTCEMRMRHKDGHWVWVLARGRIMTWDDTGKPLSMFGTHDNITDRKDHEQQLAAALSEKEVLLREVHHRVKNNLAAIISLMDMQRRTLEDPNGQVVLTDLSNRIRAMSLVHEKLYRADSLSSIDFHEYIQALTSHLRTTFGSPDIICRVDAHGITIPLDLASPCGLIVNELMTNALKYAFPDGKPRPGNTDCQILVRLRRDKDTYTLTVSDNGIGLPAEFDWTDTITLGMTLVRMLGQHQLGGRYVVDQVNGTSFTLTFTDRNKEFPVHG